MAAPASPEAFSFSYSMLSLLLILFACVELGDAASAVHVYRLIQYDLAGAPLGSRISGLNHHAATFPLDPDADLSRSALVVPLLDLDLSFLRDYITNRKPLGGLVILLPQKLGSKFGDFGKNVDLTRVKSVLNELEDLLVHAELPYPVYFAYESSAFDSLLGDIRGKNFSSQPPTSTNGGYKVVVSTSEAKKLSPPIISNIQGWLPGRKDGDSDQLPTIAIVASYDTFGAAPKLSVGSDSNGSGVAALLEIARLFSRLYSNPKTRGKYNLLFGLTSGGPYNYNGTQKWLRSFDQRVRESIDYAICLNSVGAWENDLWMHVSKPPENAYIKEVYGGFSDSAKDMGFSINVKHKKINISNPRVAWEHEHFSRFRVTALTLSGLSAAPKLLQSTGNLHDTRKSVDEKAVVRTVKMVAESLARQIYGHKGKKIDIFADNSSLAVNVYHIKSWLDILSRTPRVAAFLSKDDPLVAALKKELSDQTVEVHVQNDVLDGAFTFYDSTEAILNIYQVAGVTFDFLFLLVLGSYLIVLFSFLVITTRGLDDLINIFRRPTVRKSKSA